MGAKFTTHIHLGPRVRMSGTIHLFPPYDYMADAEITLQFTYVGTMTVWCVIFRRVCKSGKRLLISSCLVCPSVRPQGTTQLPRDGFS